MLASKLPLFAKLNELIVDTSRWKSKKRLSETPNITQTLDVKRGQLTHSNPGQPIQASGWEVSETGWASKFGLTEPATKASGKTTEHLAKASLFTSMAMFTKVTG